MAQPHEVINMFRVEGERLDDDALLGAEEIEGNRTTPHRHTLRHCLRRRGGTLANGPFP